VDRSVYFIFAGGASGKGGNGRNRIPPYICRPPTRAACKIRKHNLERELRMSLLHIHAQSYGRFFEILPEEGENAELAVEDLVSHVLLELFGEASVEVEEVTIAFSPLSRLGQRDCSLHIRAHCSPESFTLSPCSEEYMRAVIAESIYSSLREFLGSVTIESISLEPACMEAR